MLYNSYDLLNMIKMKDKQDKLNNYGIKNNVKDLSKFSNNLLDFSVKANEKAYTLSLIQEKEFFIGIMNDLIESLEIKEKRGKGRPSYFKDLLKASIIKVYLKSPSRQLNSELKRLFSLGIINSIPSFATINRFLDNKKLQPILEELITTSSLPLKYIENYMAIDATGISSFKFKRWLNLREEGYDKRKDFVKVNICCATKSKIVTALKVGGSDTGDAPYFIPLLNETAKYFTIFGVSAVKAYNSKRNFEFAEAIGAQAYIPFRENATGKSGGSYAFMRAFKLAKEQPEVYDQYYYARSLSECVFSSVKRRFLDYTRAKKQQARFNESILKFLCYNICVLVRYFCSDNFQNI